VLYELACFYFLKPETLGKVNNKKEYSSDKAEKIMAEALKIKEATLGLNHPDVSRILTRLGSLEIERVELENADKTLKRALKIREEKLGKDHSRVAQTLRHLITLYELQEKVPEAIKVSAECLRITKRINGEESIQAANVQLRLAQLYFTQDGHTSYEGKKHLKSVIAIREKKLGKDNVQVKEAQKLLEELETPPQEVVVVQKVVPIQKKPSIHRSEEDEMQKLPDISSYMSYQVDIDIPLAPSIASAPPPPPPMPKFTGIAIPPPPPSAPRPPGSKSLPPPPATVQEQILSGKPVQLKAAAPQQVHAKNKAAKEGWWKQNYQYKK